MQYKELMIHSKNLNVLLVEDDRKFLTETKELLDLFFRRVDVAYNGEEGIKAYKNFYLEADRYFDLVITDINMPLLDGEGFIKEIQFINQDQNIIVVSAYSEPSRLINFIKLGIKDFLLKPITTKDLEESLYKVSKRINQQEPKCDHIIEKEKFDNKMKNLDILCDDEGIHFDNL